MHSSRMHITVGACGFAGAQARYRAQLGAVEIDSTFYNLPLAATAARWRAAAPADFQFCLKAWQVVTHPPASPTYQRTRLDARDREHCGAFGFNPTVRWAWDRTFEIAKILEAAVVVFQSPASFRPTKEQLGRLRMFFERARRGKLLFAWEPRGDWPPEQVAGLCRELDLMRAVDPFQLAGPPADGARARYFRLHGVTGPGHQHTAAELRQLREWCGDRGRAWCFFNNLARLGDAVRFRRLAETGGRG